MFGSDTQPADVVPCTNPRPLMAARDSAPSGYGSPGLPGLLWHPRMVTDQLWQPCMDGPGPIVAAADGPGPLMAAVTGPVAGRPNLARGDHLRQAADGPGGPVSAAISGPGPSAAAAIGPPGTIRGRTSYCLTGQAELERRQSLQPSSFHSLSDL